MEVKKGNSNVRVDLAMEKGGRPENKKSTKLEMGIIEQMRNKITGKG